LLLKLLLEQEHLSAKQLLALLVLLETQETLELQEMLEPLLLEHLHITQLVMR
jgi:hypothetical protein